MKKYIPPNHSDYKKSLGQNFLKSEIYVKTMISDLHTKEDDYLIEIGGGSGAISNILSKEKFRFLDIYEIDTKYSTLLKNTFRNDKRINVINENVLDAAISESNYKIIGAIPYYITSPIFHKFLKAANRPDRIVLIIQKEFANKILEKAPKANYWSYITLGYEVTKVTDIPRINFYPVPKVDSSLIVLERNLEQEKIVHKITFNRWEKFLHHVYKTPRKMLNKRFTPEILKSSKIDPTLRPQNLELKDILRLLENNSNIDLKQLS